MQSIELKNIKTNISAIIADRLSEYMKAYAITKPMDAIKYYAKDVDATPSIILALYQESFNDIKFNLIPVGIILKILEDAGYKVVS